MTRWTPRRRARLRRRPVRRRRFRRRDSSPIRQSLERTPDHRLRTRSPRPNLPTATPARLPVIANARDKEIGIACDHAALGRGKIGEDGLITESGGPREHGRIWQRVDATEPARKSCKVQTAGRNSRSPIDRTPGSELPHFPTRRPGFILASSGETVDIPVVGAHVDAVLRNDGVCERCAYVDIPAQLAVLDAATDDPI